MGTQIEKDGNRRLIALPPDLLAQLGWDVGDVLIAEIFEDGIRFARAKTEHERTTEIGTTLMEEYRETFEALTKS